VIGLVSSTTSSADSISDSIDFGMIYYDSFTVLFSFRSASVGTVVNICDVILVRG
jgi:hypothetical protein